jgi:hypothetical protein
MGTLRDEAAVGGPCPAYGFLSQFALQRPGRIPTPLNGSSVNSDGAILDSCQIANALTDTG